MSRLTSKLTREEATNALYYKQGQEQGYKRGVLDTLNKIKAEMDELEIFYDKDHFLTSREPMLRRDDVLRIINTYICREMIESEE